MTKSKQFLRSVFSSRLTLAAALLLACLFLLALTSQYRSLDSRYQEFRNVLVSPLPGFWFPAIKAMSLDGREVCIGDGTRVAQVLLFFTPESECSNCLEALESLAGFGDDADAVGEVDVLAISFGEAAATRAFTDSLDLRLPVISFPHPRWPHVFRIPEVPQLVVLGPEGRVRTASTTVPSWHLFTDSILPLTDRLHSEASVASSEASQTCGSESGAVVHLSEEGGAR